VKLHAEYRQLFVPDSHNNVLKPGGFFQTIRDLEGTKAVVATRLERVFNASKNVLLVVGNSRRLSVHRLRGESDFTAEVLDDNLVAESYAEYRELVFEVAYGCERDAGGVRGAGAGRDH